MDALAEMYALLREEDLGAGPLDRRKPVQETNLPIVTSQQGILRASQGAYELAMTKYRTNHTTQGAGKAWKARSGTARRTPKAHTCTQILDP
ncbi:hypothetical protein TCAL_17216 [Tigriopus californicus]|uniref:Uncharacterized protein n=1 Tax=Tigriopus californicus TaxID=6832 RepID=A0A553N7P1_TIGCA|nr:hypothetical protein TCAL_17216 [Tigriopus californicus]